MPKASGIEVTRWVRANIKDVGVLGLTAYNDDPYVMAVLQAGANGYVLKTASPEELIQAVRDVHEGKSVLDPSITQKLMSQFFTGSKTPVVQQITGRELEVLSLVAKGFTNKAIGVQLGISDRTVQGHLAHIFDKLQASSRTEAVMGSILGLDISKRRNDYRRINISWVGAAERGRLIDGRGILPGDVMTVPSTSTGSEHAALLAAGGSPYAVKLPLFEGPLDLLLHLVKTNEVDIYRLPIAVITDQYLEYLGMFEELDLDIAGDYLVMAATLA